MFRVDASEREKTHRLAVAGLLILSLAALAVTIWVMVDFLHEQEIVGELIEQLPPQATESAEALAGELRWQFRLTILVVLNLIVTGFALLLLWRAYRSSQESLRDIKAQAGDILSSMDQAVITTDLSGQVTSINRRGHELLGLTEDCVGKQLTSLTGTIPLEAFRREAIPGGATQWTRDFMVPASGTTRTLRAFCQALRNHADDEIGSVLQLRDVTERALMDDRMRRMERYMGLGSLAAGLHHEIKNPLAALSLHVQLLEEELDGQQTSAEVHEMMGVIKTEVTRVGGVLESFRDFASLAHLNCADTDLRLLIDRQVRLIGPQAERQKIRIRVDLPTSPLPKLQVDRVRLEQVLLNLLVNAMEAMPDGGTLTIQVSADADSRPRTIRINVIDTGSGVPENLRDRIFDPYFTTKNHGTGMGLALCDKIIRQHHGSLDFQSSPGGTVFTITLHIE